MSKYGFTIPKGAVDKLNKRTTFFSTFEEKDAAPDYSAFYKVLQEGTNAVLFVRVYKMFKVTATTPDEAITEDEIKTYPEKFRADITKKKKEYAAAWIHLKTTSGIMPRNWTELLKSKCQGCEDFKTDLGKLAAGCNMPPWMAKSKILVDILGDEYPEFFIQRILAARLRQEEKGKRNWAEDAEAGQIICKKGVPSIGRLSLMPAVRDKNPEDARKWIGDTLRKILVANGTFKGDFIELCEACYKTAFEDFKKVYGVRVYEKKPRLDLEKMKLVIE